MEACLPNGSDGDALLLVRLPHEGLTVAFDCGDARRIPQRDVLRLAHLFVSHCHVDHFIGLDALVRPRVCRADEVVLHGGPGIRDRVASRLAGYTWNLVEGNHFVLTVREREHGRVASTRFDSGREFRREDLPDEPCDAGGADGLFAVESRELDHFVVSMGWAIERPKRIHVDPERVAARKLPSGPWLGELKRAIAEGAPASTRLALPGGAEASVGDLARDFVTVQRGERVAFVTDTACTDVTRPRIVELARDADVFACGAPFAQAESDRAAEKRHLTASQAGSMAAEAGAKTLLLFHVSDRYAGDFARHVEEAAEAARGSVEVRVETPWPVVTEA